MDFDLRQLEIFCKVVELGSFSNAAKAVHLAQSSVSERIVNLEDMVGTKLFDRLGRQVVPTSAGTLLYEHAIKLLKMKQEVCLEMEAFLGVRQGMIYIGASTIPGDYILPKVIGRFREKYPEITMHLSTKDTDLITNEVSNGVFEIGFVGSKGNIRNLVYEELWEDELVLVVPSKHPWSRKKSVFFNDLCNEPFIRREYGSGTQRTLEDHLKKVHPNGIDALNIISILGSSTAVKEAVKSGLGVAIISSRAVETEVRSKILKAIKVQGISIHRSFYLIYDKRRTLSPLCRAFIDFLSSEKTPV